MARLKILSADELTNLYATPKLEDADRKLVFDLDDDDLAYISNIDLPRKIDYILQLTYFKLSQYFFSFTFQGSRSDVWYVIKTYFPDSKFPKKNISKNHSYQNRKAVLNKYDMVLYSSKFKAKLIKYAQELAKKHVSPKYIFDSLLNYSHQNKVVRPSYSTLQEVVSDAIDSEKNRLSNKLYTLMDKQLRNDLDLLLEKDDDFYQLTNLKKDQKDFSTTEIRKSVTKHQSLDSLYQNTTEIINQLGLSEQNMRYYSDLAAYYTVYGLKSMRKKNLSRLYLLCYIRHRYLKLNDHLMFSFTHKVSYYKSEGEAYKEKALEQHQLNNDDDIEKVGTILSLFTDKKVTDNELRNRAWEITPKEQFINFVRRVVKPKFNAESHRWVYYTKDAQAIKNNLRGSFKALGFQTKNNKLEIAIAFLKSHFEGTKAFKEYTFEDVPIDFIPRTLKRYVIDKVRIKGTSKRIKKINADRYEFMVYLMIDKAFTKGDVTLRDSISHKSLEDHLVAKPLWLKNKKNLISSLENKLLETDIQVILADLESRLNPKYKEINSNITKGPNDKIKINRNKKGEVVKWRLPYKKADDGVNNPYYDNLPTVSVSSVIKFAAAKSELMKKFKHILPKYSKNKPNESAISACIVAQGTGSDIHRMKQISNIKESDLTTASEDFIRCKTLDEASDGVINIVAKLPIFEKYALSDYGVHASVDGQKLETKYNVIKARYSPKYFGFGKGVSAYTLFANCLPLCSKVIGANEHESYYLFDILNSNTSDVRITKVSGDMHSINRVNFALLYLFGYSFMPRFTKLDKKAAANLVSFDDPKSYEDHIIKPSKKVDTKLIIKEWDNILRILTTLGIKKNTQSHIVRKLSSYRSNDTLRAIIEFDKIIMSLYMLDYIDDEQIRKNVHRSLNRGESYHQLRSAIAKVSGRKLAGKNEIELEINNECARLLANCIIFYNASILSGLYEYYKKNQMDDECQKIIRLSPVAWQHINLIGMYEFGNSVQTLDLQGMIENIIKDPKINLSLAA